MSCGSITLKTLATIGAVAVAGGMLRDCGYITGNPRTDFVDVPLNKIGEQIANNREFDTYDVPTGKFTIDFYSARQAPVDRQIKFTVLGRSIDDKQIKIDTMEIGHETDAYLYGPARFNVVFRESKWSEKPSLRFQVQLGKNEGVTILPYDGSLDRVLISDGGRTCGELDKKGKVKFYQGQKPHFIKAELMGPTTEHTVSDSGLFKPAKTRSPYRGGSR